MDPVSLVVAALSAGAGAVAKDTVSLAVKDAYAGLKTMILARAKDTVEAEKALGVAENDPAAEKPALAELVASSDADKDPNLLSAAQRVLQLLSSEQQVSGKFNVQISGSAQGQQIGDFTSQHNVFGALPKS